MTSPHDTKIAAVSKTGPKPTILAQPKPEVATSTKKVKASAQRLVDLTDVDITNPADGDVLVYNADTGMWEASASAGGSGLTHPQVMKRIHAGL